MENISYSDKALAKQKQLSESKDAEIDHLKVLESYEILIADLNEVISRADHLYTQVPNKELYDTLILLKSANKSANLIQIIE